MRIPNSEQAVVPEEKLLNYLLSPSHTVGRFKSRFFRALGYTPENWETLADELARAAQSEDAEELESPYGRKFRIVSELVGTSGVAGIVSIWIVSGDDDRPRFVTAYPLE